MVQQYTDTHGNFQKPGRPPQISDVNFLTLRLVAESLSIDSGHTLFQHPAGILWIIPGYSQWNIPAVFDEN